MVVLIKAAQLIVSLSILVIVHELGHFLFAKLFRTRVEKFYLFFNPWFSLFKKKIGETEYGLGWLPLGGYVKISGMIDESLDKEALSQPAQPWEFRSKTALQRLLIMVGGVMMNFLLAMIIYIMVLFYWGEEYIPVENMKYGIVCDSVAQSIGLRDGDKIISIDNQKIDNYRTIVPFILLNDSKTFQIKRNDIPVNVEIPSSVKARIIKHESFFVDIAFPFVVGDFSEDSNAKKAGLQVNDQIIGIDSLKLPFFTQYPPVLQKNKSKEVKLLIIRNNDTLSMPCLVNEKGLIGVAVKSMTNFFDVKTIEYGFIEAIPAGLSKGYNQIGDYLKQFKLIFSPETEAYKSVGSFISIGKIFPDQWEWYTFWSMTALLSIMLAVLNILPIPALDGGHVLFLLYEIIVGKKPSDKFLEYAQITGMVLLLTLMVFALGNDIFRNFIK